MPDPSLPVCRLEIDSHGADPARLFYACAPYESGALAIAGDGSGLYALFLGDTPAQAIAQLRDAFPRTTLDLDDGGVLQASLASITALVTATERGEVTVAVTAVAAVAAAQADGGLDRTGAIPALDPAGPAMRASGKGAASVVLRATGSTLRRKVWSALCEIPAGQTISYTELASRVGRPDAVRAVAGAVAANRFAVLVPCHRVIRNDGSISGYRWGPDRKRALLGRERGLS